MCCMKYSLVFIFLCGHVKFSLLQQQTNQLDPCCNNQYNQQYTHGNQNTYVANTRTQPFPKYVLPLLPLSSLKPYSVITWHYVPIDLWQSKRSTIPRMSESSHSRETKIVGFVLNIMGKLFPWFSFEKADSWESADIRFAFLSDYHQIHANEVAHVHLKGDTLQGHVHLSPKFWDYRPNHFAIVFHEMLHLLGNDHTPIYGSVMSPHLYTHNRPFYQDVITSTYAYYGEEYKKNLIPYKAFKKIVREMVVHNKLFGSI